MAGFLQFPGTAVKEDHVLPGQALRGGIMDEYVSSNPEEMQVDPDAPGDPQKMSNKQRLRLAITDLERRLNQKQVEVKEGIRQTAEADRADLKRMEQNLSEVRQRIRGGWDRVTEAAAGALLKLLK
jgi:hypothetical protein